MAENIILNGGQLFDHQKTTPIQANKPTLGVSVNGVSVTSGDPAASKENPIFKKHADAKRQAMRIVADTLKSETGLDNELAEIHKRNGSLLETVRDELEAAAYDQGHIAELKDLAGVDDDSEEQQDLLLLMRDIDDPAHLSFTDEEKARLSELTAMRMSGSLTMYQESALSAYESQKQHEKNASDAELEFHANTAGLRAAAIDRLKSAPMLSAVKEKDSLMDAANDALIGDLLNEAKEHIDEEHERMQEEAEKIKEAREKVDERIEKTRNEHEDAAARTERLREENAINENILDHDLDPAALQERIKQDIKRLLDEMKLTPDDITGAAIDKRV